MRERLNCNIRELMEQPTERFDLPRYSSERRNGMGLVNQGQSLYILGKPGAGKTTFLKNVAVRAIANQLGASTRQRLPLFVPLHEWANSRHSELLPFLVAQLDTHHFPEAEEFLTHLLENGNGLLLFDGLDEVRQERDQRAATATALRNFTKKYDRCQYLITCRVAASEYEFEGLRTVEVADFTRLQSLDYARKWFGESEQKYESFAADLEKPENAGLAELCNVPLLLSLLCLYYDDAQSFPTRRAELYEDALDALLRKWDSSRQIARDEIYRGLSHKRKQQMFAHIATPAFEKGQLYWTTKQLAEEISRYLSHVPGAPPVEEIDGEAILRAIEAQHGVLVERAHNIHSFSHLTFQEYFTARYIVENEARGTVKALIEEYLTDQRWREVFLLTASLLDNADNLMGAMLETTEKLSNSSWLAEILNWANAKAHETAPRETKSSAITLRLAYVFLIVSCAIDLAQALDISRARTHARSLARTIDLGLAHAFDLALALSHPFDLALDLDLTLALSRARALHSIVSVDYALLYSWSIADFLASISEFEDERSRFVSILDQLIEFCEEMKATDLAIVLGDLPLPSNMLDDAGWRLLADSLRELLTKKRGFLIQRKISLTEYNQMNRYFYANELLIRCLDLAYVTNRQEILYNLLRPPSPPPTE